MGNPLRKNGRPTREEIAQRQQYAESLHLIQIGKLRAAETDMMIKFTISRDSARRYVKAAQKVHLIEAAKANPEDRAARKREIDQTLLLAIQMAIESGETKDIIAGARARAELHGVNEAQMLKVLLDKNPGDLTDSELEKALASFGYVRRVGEKRGTA